MRAATARATGNPRSRAAARAHVAPRSMIACV
jgi:hypothetical protein